MLRCKLCRCLCVYLWVPKKATPLLQESFDPILDIATGEDLVVAMVRAAAVGDFDFSGMFTAILRYQVSLASEPLLVMLMWVA